jgi:hypothetical protein
LLERFYNEGRNVSKKKDKFLQILSKAKYAAKKLASKGREFVKQGQFAADLAACNEEFIHHFPDDSFLSPAQWDDQIAAWNGLGQYADVVILQLDNMSQFIIPAVTGTSLASSTVISSGYIPRLPISSQDAARKTYEGYEQLLERSNLVSEIEIEIHRLGLASSAPESKSILSLILQSKHALEVPSMGEVSPPAVLIPLREAINRALADLLRKRPRQEKARAIQDKVRSICGQVCKPFVDGRQIAQLEQEAHDLNHELSEAKQRSMMRERVRELMNRGFVFLLSLLRTLDENKMHH